MDLAPLFLYIFFEITVSSHVLLSILLDIYRNYTKENKKVILMRDSFQKLMHSCGK